ncbi:MAG TPA: NYN domain-containing protein [Ktedonobacteraceae bacterium]|nr:NYN domain-containing protein [Ktedonobacteraceae bacterium]
MVKEKVVLFLDYANISRAARDRRYRLDYHHLLHYVGEGRFLVDAHCYVPINPRNEHRADGVIEELWRSGYIVNTKMGTIAGGTYKCNFDVEITMDVLKVVYQVRPDIVVLASGDADFVPLIQEVRKSGVRVEVAAFEGTAGAGVLLKCSGFIDLAVYYDGYLAAQNGVQDEDRVEEQYKGLIQSQNGERSESGVAEQDQVLIQPDDSDLDEDSVKPVDQVDKQTGIPASDIIDQLGL